MDYVKIALIVISLLCGFFAGRSWVPFNQVTVDGPAYVVPLPDGKLVKQSLPDIPAEAFEGRDALFNTGQIQGPSNIDNGTGQIIK